MDDSIYFDLVEFYQSRPAEFAEDMLGFVPDSRQRDIMESVRDHRRTAVRSGQGVGKTAAVACILIWFLCTRYNARIMATAPNILQLQTSLWGEIQKWLAESPLREFLHLTKTRLAMKGYENTWFAFAKTAAEAEGMAGQHADHLLVIADEASGIKDQVLETLLGTVTGKENRLLLISNPTRRWGVFYDAFHRNASMYSRIHIDGEQCERVDEENRDMIARCYGAQSNVYRIRVKGEFPTGENDVFIPLELIMEAVSPELSQDRELSLSAAAFSSHGPSLSLETSGHGDVFEQLFRLGAEENGVPGVRMGVDVARFGQDDTVIAVNCAGHICKLIKRHGSDTSRTTGEVLRWAQELRRCLGPACQIVVVVDDTGVGGGVTDQLRQQKGEQSLEWLHIIPVNAAQSVNSTYYHDTTTFMWAAVKELLQRRELLLPEDGDLTAQLSDRRFLVMPSGKLRLESKKEMKKRGVRSPDTGDAVALSCWPVNWSKLLGKDRPSGRRGGR